MIEELELKIMKSDHIGFPTLEEREIYVYTGLMKILKGKRTSLGLMSVINNLGLYDTRNKGVTELGIEFIESQMTKKAIDESKIPYLEAKKIVAIHDRSLYLERQAFLNRLSTCPFCSGGTTPFIHVGRSQICTMCDGKGNIKNEMLIKLDLDKFIEREQHDNQ